VTETYWCPGPWPWQWARTCTREVPDPPPDPCAAPACAGAKARLEDARGRFRSNCDGLRMIEGVSRILRPIVAAPIWILVVLAVIAAIIGGPIAVIIWGLIAIYGISWFLLFVLAAMARSIGVSLNQARLDFEAAAKDVALNCPPQCIGDLTLPECSVI
jgi:hypothetical protein